MPTPHGIVTVVGMPTATGADEIPVSSGAGTTYVPTAIVSILSPILGGGVPWDVCVPNEALTTSTATPAVISSVDLDTYGGAGISVLVSAHNNAKTVACDWDIRACIVNDGGALTIVDSVVEPTDPVSTLAVALVINGTMIDVQVTGVASGGNPDLDVNWLCGITARLHGTA